LKEWKIIKSPLPENPTIHRIELYRQYKFESFDLAIEYISKVAVACDIFPHHPRWENIWTTLSVWLTTWDIVHMISYKDIMLARHMDKLFLDYSNSVENKHSGKRIEHEKSEFINQIKKLIGEDNLESAFEYLNAFITLNPEKDISDDFILLTGSFNQTQKAKRRGEQTIEQINCEIDKQRARLLDLLNHYNLH
jgi:pterin-4a-carbinolamine dehydratase